MIVELLFARRLCPGDRRWSSLREVGALELGPDEIGAYALGIHWTWSVMRTILRWIHLDSDTPIFPCRPGFLR